MATKITPNPTKITQPQGNNIANSSDILKLLESSMENSNKVLTQLNDIGKYLKNYKSVKQNLNKYVMFINDVLQAYQQISVNQITLQGLLKQNISGEIFKKLFTDISSIAEGIQTLSNIKITKRMIKRVVNNINRLPEILNFNIVIDKEKIKQLSESVEQLKGVFDDIIEIYKSLENISKKSILVTLLLPVILIGMMALSLTTFIIATNIMFISGVLTALIPILGPCVSEVVIVINAMEEIFKSVFEISKICVKMLFLQVFVKLGFKSLNKVIMEIISTSIYISVMNSFIKPKQMIESTINIYLMGVIINKINKIIKKLVITVLLFPIGLLGLLCLRILISSISLLLETLTNVKFQITILQAFRIIKKLTLSFLLLTTMSIALTLFGLMVMTQYKALVVGILSMIVILGAMYLMFKLIKLIGKTIQKSILSILLLIVAVTLISVAIGALVLVAMLADQISWEAFGKVAAVIGGFILLLVLASVFSAFILIGAVALAVVGLAMVMIVAPLLIMVVALIILQNIDVESSMVALRTLLTGFVTTIVSVFTLENMLGLFVAVISMIPLIIVSMGLIVVIGILKITSILMGDDMLTQLENLGEVLNVYIQIIVGTFTLGNMVGLFVAMIAIVPLTIISMSLIVVVGILSVINSIMNENADVEGGMTRLGRVISSFINTITENISLKTTAKLMLALPAIAMIGMMALSLSAVAYTIQSFANLSIPTKYDEKGNPIEFRQMNQTDFDFASNNMVNIMTTLIKAISDPELVKQIDDMGVIAIAKIGFILSVVGNLKNIVEVIQQMSHMSVATKFDSNGNPIEFKSITPEERDAAIATTISLMTDLLKAMTSEEITSQLDDMGSRSRKNLETIMSSTGGIKDLVDAIKTAATFEDGEVANGIGTIRSLIIEYAGLMSDLFVNKWDSVWEKKKILGVNVPYLTFKIVDKAQIDVDSLDDAIDGMQELLKPLEPTKQLIDKIKEILKDADYTDMPPQLDAMKNSILDYVRIVTDKRLLFIDFSKSSEKLTMLSGITDQVKPLIDKLNDMSQNYNFLGIQKDVNDLGKTIIAYTEIFTGNSKGEGGINISSIGRKKFNMFQKLVKEQQKFAKIDTKQLSESTEQFIKVFDKINTIDNDKIKSTADMFAQMTKLSKSIKGNFEGLAEALNENLLTVLEELKDILEQTNGIIENKSSQSTSTVTQEVTQTQQPIQSTTQQNNTTNNTTKENQSKPTDITPVIEKLESLLQQFKSGVPVYSKMGQPLQVRTT